MKKKLITVVLLASILVSSLSISVAAEAAEELEPVNATMISNEYKETNKTIKSSKIGYQPVFLTVVDINSSYTVWDVKITNITEPYYGYQCYETKLQIYRPDKGLKSTYDETLLDFSPESTNGSSSKTIGVSVSGGNANPTASFSQSISDCTIAVSNQGYNNFKEWQYRYITNTTIAKGSTKQTALTRWANKKGAFSVSLNSYARVIFSNPVGFPVYSSTTWFLRLDKNDIK